MAVGVGASIDAQLEAVKIAQGLAMGIDADPEPVASLAAERSGLSGFTEAVSLLWHGSQEAVSVGRLSESLLRDDKAFDKTALLMLSRAQQYRRAIAVTRRLAQLRREQGWGADDWRFWALKMQCSDDSPLLVHDTVFVPALRHLTSPAQRDAWLQPALEYAILGCYAQTELGHGSNVAGIETTATFLPSTGEIELHTPRLEATKWWVGNLGRTATHAIVWAQLLVPEPGLGSRPFKSVGPHPFFLRIRSADSHECVQGVLAGDIGPKLGFAAVDNGFLRLVRVRVPRAALLGACGSVNRQGVYTAPSHPKRAYAGMMAARVILAQQSALALALAVTVAARYSCLRRQFRLPAAAVSPALVEAVLDAPRAAESRAFVPGETAILDYALQRRRVLPWLAVSWGLQCATAALGEWHGGAMAALRRAAGSPAAPAAGAAEAELGELHCLTAAVKSVATSLAAEGMEECRRACGGHGYSSFSGIGPKLQSFVHTCTAEGDNGVMLLQASRKILRARAQAGAAAEAGAREDVRGGVSAGRAGADRGALRAGGGGGFAAACEAARHHTAYLGVGPAAEAWPWPAAARTEPQGALDGEAFGAQLREARFVVALLTSGSAAAADACLLRMQGEAEAAMEDAAGGEAGSPVAQAAANAQVAAAEAARMHAMAVLCATFVLATAPADGHSAGSGGIGPAASPGSSPAAESVASAPPKPVPLSDSAAAAAATLCPGVALVARELALLCSLTCLERALPHLLGSDTRLPARAAALVALAIDESCARLRPVAVAIVDGMGLGDHALASALGRRDGAAYEGMWRWASASSLAGRGSGDGEARAALHESIRPMMREGLEALRRAGADAATAARL